MDIDMPGINGLELAKNIREKAKYLIFTTAHPDYALQAFDVQSDQYLLKPISFAKFALGIDRILKRNQIIIAKALRKKLIRLRPFTSKATINMLFPTSLLMKYFISKHYRIIYRLLLSLKSTLPILHLRKLKRP